MELKAAVHGLQRTKPQDRITIYTDSDYVYNHAISQQLLPSDRDGELWKSLRAMCRKCNVTWRLIRSGSTEMNRICDRKAREAARNHQ